MGVFVHPHFFSLSLHSYPFGCPKIHAKEGKGKEFVRGPQLTISLRLNAKYPSAAVTASQTSITTMDTPISGT